MSSTSETGVITILPSSGLPEGGRHDRLDDRIGTVIGDLQLDANLQYELDFVFDTPPRGGLADQRAAVAHVH